MITSEIYKTGVALVTPFNPDGSVDFNSIKTLVDYVINGGVNYLVVLGTTGEAATLNETEKVELVDFIVKYTNKRVPIVLGMGNNDTAALVNTLRNYNFEGIHSILSVVPWYNKPNQKGIYSHFEQVALNSPVPIILYNVPSRTSSCISAETVIKLARNHPNIIGIKEASGDINIGIGIAKNKPEGFSLISGDDQFTLPLLSVGGNGVISVIANAYPAIMSTLVSDFLSNRRTEAQKELYKLHEITNAIFEEGNPSGIKYLLNQLNICKPFVRLPLVEISEELSLKINTFLKLV